MVCAEQTEAETALAAGLLLLSSFLSTRLAKPAQTITHPAFLNLQHPALFVEAHAILFSTIDELEQS